MQLKFMTFLTVRIMWHFSSLCVYLYSQKREGEKNGGIMAGRQRSEWRKIILPLINYDHLRYHTSVAKGPVSVERKIMKKHRNLKGKCNAFCGHDVAQNPYRVHRERMKLQKVIPITAIQRKEEALMEKNHQD